MSAAALERWCCCLAWLRRRRDGYDVIAEDALPPAAAPRPSHKAREEPRRSAPRAITGSEEVAGAGGARVAFIEKYELKESIGLGSTSSCYRCVHSVSGQEFAVKIIDKRKIEAEYKGMIAQFYNEIEILKALRHPNIIQLEEVIESEAKIYIVMELMRGGELFDYIVARGKLRESEAQDIAQKIIAAVAYMHAEGIIHRDLKPENLLLTTGGSDHDLKLIDFGLSKAMHDEDASSFLGTKGYLAPEMLQRRAYSKAVDCWAMGIIVFILLCGCLPFDDDTSAIASPLLNSRFKLRFPHWAQNLSSGAKDLLQGLLETNPRKRLTAEQALRHPWVRGNNSDVNKTTVLQSPHIMGSLRTPRSTRAMPDVAARQRANEDYEGDQRSARDRVRSSGTSIQSKSGMEAAAAAGWEYYNKPSQAEAVAAIRGRAYNPQRPTKRPSF